MQLLRSFLLVACVAAASAPSTTRADCIEQTDRFTFDAAFNRIVELKSYICGTGDDPNAAHIAVTFLRFGDLPASIIAGRVRSEALNLLIGSPTIVENEVFRAYADLLGEFGTTIKISKNSVRNLSLNGVWTGMRSMPPDDFIQAEDVRVLTGRANQFFPSGTYPAAAEITSLRRSMIPEGMHFFYDVECGDEQLAPEADCKNVGKTTMRLWRSLRAEDIHKYAENLKAFNGMLGQTKRAPMTVAAGLPPELKLAQHLAGPEWPEDFLVIIGDNLNDDCSAGSLSVNGWQFDYWMRAATLDAVLIENLSVRPVAIGELFGGRSAEPRLRPIASLRDSNAVWNAETTLAHEEKILIPTRVGFTVKSGLRGKLANVQLSRQQYRARGADPYKGFTQGHGMPDLRDFTFGPELSVNGITIDGERHDFGRRLDNAFDMAVAVEARSCPYLMSWSGDRSGWIEHGKVLDEAPDKTREYTDTRVSSGFVSRYRIEEREPEVAYLDQAELLVSLKNGETLTLKADDPRLADRDQDYLELAWGDAIEFAFALPDGVAEEDVVESRLSVTGYYRRYANLMAEQRAPRRTWLEPLRQRAVSVNLNTPWAASTGSACPASAFSSRALLLRERSETDFQPIE